MIFFKVVALIISSLFITIACSDSKDINIIDINLNADLPIDNTPIDDSTTTSSTENNNQVYDTLSVATLNNGSQFIDPYNNSTYKTILYYAPNNPTDNYYNTTNYTISTSGSTSNKLYNSYKLSGEKDKPVVNNLSSFRDLEKYFLDNKIPQAIPIRAKGTSSYTIGQVFNNIYVLKDGNNFTTVSMRCVDITDEAYIFVENTLANFSDSNLKNIREGIDELFPKIHNLYGRPNDIDGNGKVIILFAKFSDNSLLGYFNPGDKFTKQYNQKSNVKDIFYVNYNAVARDINDVLSTIAHEYQHMIHFDVRSNKKLTSLDLWINEGLSMQAMYHTGYLFKQKSDYLKYFVDYYIGESLIESRSNEFTVGNYGYTLVYFRYLLERFGDDLIKKLYNSSQTGIKAIEEVTGEKFNDIFRDFVKAVFLNGNGYNLPKEYSLTTIDLSKYNNLALFEDLDVGESLSTSLIPYGLHLIKWNGLLNTINLSGSHIGGYGYSFDK